MYSRLPLVLLMAALFSCGSKEQKNTAAAVNRSSGPMLVDGFIVHPQSVSDDIQVPGSLLPAEETQIRAEVSGRIVKLNIEEGSTVQKGTLLVKLFDQDLQAQLKKLQVQLQIAQKTEERQRELLKISGVSQQDYDLSVLQVDNLKADIMSVQIAIDKTEIRAPYQGKIGLRNVSLGSFLSPNDIVATLRQVTQLKLEFSIPEKYAKNVAKGYRVQFKVDGGDDTHHATVIATESGVDQATRTLRVRALVNDSHPELVPGVFAKVDLELGKDADALMIPTQAVIPQARNKQVVVLRRDSAAFVEVETGIRDSAFVQITNGLKPGDTVVTTGLMAIRPSSKIKIGNVKNYQSMQIKQ
ncbi:efflux RND transporter periplasmic adaptor subunit [Pseudochryseolinea flava]|nr:efflux RND transporter periplasmic adaptor subunit [Pseudochryseolinea flava]